MAYSFGSIIIWRKIDLLRNVLIGFVLIAMILVSVAFGADTRQKEDALAAAENWLTMIDHGEYAKSWRKRLHILRQQSRNGSGCNRCRKYGNHLVN